jgi:serine/threonine-protein kinase
VNGEAHRARDGRDPRIGTRIGGKFLVLERIGAGGMGRVYRAEQQPLGRIVALKVVRVTDQQVAEGSEGDVVEKRFFREASILARLSHPNVVTVYDFGKIDPSADDEDGDRQYYMAMELVQGQTLEARLSGRGPTPSAEAVKIVRQIARGLHEAHALGVVHRDLKPANVMLTRARDGEEIVKLLDFGIGKIVDDEANEQPQLTMDGIFVGSPGYVSPEQVMTGIVDARSDIYSLGVVMYRMLAGRPLFPQHRTAMALMTAHVHDEPERLQDVVADVPPWLAELVHRCLEKSPEKRPQSVEEVLAELTSQGAGDPAPLGARPAARVEGFRVSLPPAAPEVPTIADGSISTTGPLSRDGRKSTPAWMFVVPVAVVLLVGLGVWAWQSHAPDPAGPAGTTGSAPAGAASFTLILDSTPSGAQVREGERVLGTTPLALKLDPKPLAEAPRAFTIEHEGFKPYVFAQGPAHETVRVVAPLVAIEAPKPAPADSVEPTTSATTKPAIHTNAGAKPAPTTKPPPPVDIQLQR